MDTSKEYIKMCEKAKEIQKIGKISKGWSGIFRIGEYIYFGVWGGHNGVEDVAERIIWLPRQDQLQEMVDYDLTNRCVEFYCFVSGRVPLTNEIINAGQLHKFTSMEQLWLAFVMKEKYNKIWNGKDWEKVK